MDSLDIIFHREFVKAMAEAMEPRATEIILGKFDDFAAYKQASGHLGGMQEALNLAKAVQDRILKQDKERR